MARSARRTTPRGAGAGGGLTLALALLAAPALAELEICNTSDRQLSIAIGSYQQGSWTSSGWWIAAPSACVTPVGGDLQNRYYYYRAMTTEGVFIEGDTYFCVSEEVFTAPGQGNCAARGYREVGFATLDTGTEGRSFRLSLRDAPDATTPHQTTPHQTGAEAGAPAGLAPLALAPPAPAQVMRPSAPPAPAAPAPGAPPAPAAPPPMASAAVLQPPGTYGEPFADAVVLQECLSEVDMAYCSFQGSGTRFYVYDDGRTPAEIFTTLHGLSVGAPLSIEGDLEGIYDRSADLVLRQVLPRAWTEADAILHSMQGRWYSVADPAARFTIRGAERENTYNDTYISTDYLSLRDSCGAYSGNGPYLYARDEETGEDFCYAIDSIADQHMRLIYLPRGTVLEYRSRD